LSNRAIAKVVGVDETTIGRDAAANAAPDRKKTKQNGGAGTAMRQMPHPRLAVPRPRARWTVRGEKI